VELEEHLFPDSRSRGRYSLIVQLIAWLWPKTQAWQCVRICHHHIQRCPDAKPTDNELVFGVAPTAVCAHACVCEVRLLKNRNSPYRPVLICYDLRNYAILL
jgi:hypothetical protein